MVADEKEKGKEKKEMEKERRKEEEEGTGDDEGEGKEEGEREREEVGRGGENEGGEQRGLALPKQRSPITNACPTAILSPSGGEEKTK